MQFPPSKSTPAFPSVTLCTIPLYMWKGFFGDHDHPGQEKGKLGELRLRPRQQHRDALLATHPCLCLGRRGVPLDEVFEALFFFDLMLVLFAFSLLWSSLGDLSGSVDMFELKKQSSCSLELINKTDQYLAFKLFGFCNLTNQATCCLKLSDNQAQKMFGNRWTEIAKVVSGRIDNAVKNHFSTLCKKREKFEASSKENSVPSLDPSNKRVLVEEPSIAILIGEPSTSNKKMGYHISPLKETIEAHRRSLREHGPAQHLQRPPLLEVQNFDTVNQSSASNKVSQATFLGRDDPKLTALLQQAELLTNLSKKVNAENTNQSLDEAWKVLILSAQMIYIQFA
ncbi:hypothetical protein ZIOFF_001722 [Zingiber officinale]|uniref:HTH myb-type domain-containing protein n=1 Tax=Zingiber officinale TaxID=94328 RepID=A0A8J5HVS6_ZINOF|nr:hypothetical protein ZIOFF_001722 [Zingiber officinale]